MSLKGEHNNDLENVPTNAIIGNLQLCCSGINTTQLTYLGKQGGTWTSDNINLATVDSTGLVTSKRVGSGIVKITYTIGSVSTSVIIICTVTPSAGSISGASTVAVGNTIDFTNTGSGGYWSTSNAARATVIYINSTTGRVTGVATGAVVIQYTVGNACGTSTGSQAITVT